MKQAPTWANQAADDSREIARTSRSYSAGYESIMHERGSLPVAPPCIGNDLETRGSTVPSLQPVQLVRGILSARSDRAKFFAAELFSDPAWDMLLDLYAAQLAQVRVTVTSLCVASNSPTTTALRWITALQGQDLIERRADPLDGRRIFISLTAKGSEALDQYFASLKGRAVI